MALAASAIPPRSTFFFPPVAQAVNLNLPPQTTKWFETYGRGNAAAFDRQGWQYFVRGVFDFFYPGYWDEWATFQGASGMTYETDGGPQYNLRREGYATPYPLKFQVDDTASGELWAFRLWSPDYQTVSPDKLAAARRWGMKVTVWTVNEPADIERMLAMGVDGIASDYPDRVLAQLKGKR